MKVSRFSYFSVVFALVVFVGAFTPGVSGHETVRPVSGLEPVQYYGADVVRGEVLVQFREDVSTADQARVHSSLGVEALEEFAPQFIRVDFNDRDVSMDRVLAHYQKDPSVEFAQPNYLYEPYTVPNDPKWDKQWGPAMIKCPIAWDMALGDPDAVVAVIDTGVDMDHPDLQSQYAYGYDYYDGDPNPNDQAGHGSHTCGSAAGAVNNGIGIAGVAVNCRFAAYRTGDYWLPDSAIISSINDARDKGALVISMSFGSGSSSPGMEDALNDAYDAGMVNVASAGNEGNTQKRYPASYANVISVAASNALDERAAFSTYGSWVDVAAPGTNVLSCYKNGNYTYLNGTSMSCPHVSGMALLLYSMLPGGRTKANSDTVRNTIQDTAVDIGSWTIHGRVDLALAVYSMGNLDIPVITDISPAEVQGFGGETITVTGTDMGSVLEVDAGGVILKRDIDFKVVDADTITFPAPVAASLGPQDLYVTNFTGTSAPAGFTYVKTDPPKLVVPFIAFSGYNFKWTFGADANDFYWLLFSTNSVTVPVQGYKILKNYALISVGTLSAGGVGSLEMICPPGYYGEDFYSQFVVFDGGYIQASGVGATFVVL